MKKLRYFALLIVACVNFAGFSAFSQDDKLWYQQPAREWMEATPIGNGRLGAMVYGGVDRETVALNESTMWSGQYNENQEKPFGKERLTELRKLFFDGKLTEGNRIASEHLYGNFDSFGTHLPVGDLVMNFTYPEGRLSDYRRELDFANALNQVTFSIGDIRYKREFFGSNPNDVLVIRLSADKSSAITMDIGLNMLRESDIKTVNGLIEFSGKASFPMHGPGGVNFTGKIGVKANGGILSSGNDKLFVKDATSVEIIIDIRTDYKNDKYKELCDKTLKAAQTKSYEDIKTKHIADFSRLYNRVEMFLGDSNTGYLPTDVRWQRVKEGKNDVGLDALFFQYARYLMISASRENSPLPAPLQAVWNDNLACNMSWTNDYHLDINTEQNYWIANVGNLAECHQPLFRYMKDLSEHGSKTARTVYGCRGWTAHTVANVWGYTAPSQSIMWGLFPTASSWLASHLWTQYKYTQDKEFLAKEAYPLLKGNATFLLDYMVINPHNGYLMTGPSISPENWFKVDGEGMVASMMPTCDRELAFETFTACIEAAKILNTDKKFADSLKVALSKLPPIKIGKSGAVQEWFEDYEEAQPNHRHTSHLLALYPFSQITLEKTPELAKAARKTIEKRLAAEGWEDTEWSRANMICFYARLKDAAEAYKSVELLQKDFTRENLLSISPAGIALAPYDIFIFDGNTAGAAGIAEMLLQNHEGYIEFLPALPEQWHTGRFKGLCITGGAEVDLQWKNSIVESAQIRATSDNIFRLKLPANGQVPQFVKDGKSIQLKQKTKGLVEFSLKKGEVLILKYR